MRVVGRPVERVYYPFEGRVLLDLGALLGEYAVAREGLFDGVDYERFGLSVDISYDVDSALEL